jgi:hypothetical protein
MKSEIDLSFTLSGNYRDIAVYYRVFGDKVCIDNLRRLIEVYLIYLQHLFSNLDRVEKKDFSEVD